MDEELTSSGPERPATRSWLITGRFRVLLGGYVKRIIAQISAESDAVYESPRRLTGRDLTAGDIAKELGTGSLFGGGRILIVDGLSGLRPGVKDELMQQVSNPASTGYLIVTEAGEDEWGRPKLPLSHPIRKTFASSRLAESFEVKTPASGTASTTRRLLEEEGLSIEDQALDRLIELTAGDLDSIAAEMDKLGLSADARPLDTALVEALIPPSRDSRLSTLVETVFGGDLIAALAGAHAAKAEGISPAAIVATVERQLRQANRVSELLAAGMSDQAIGSALKIKPGALFYLKQRAAKVQPSAYRRLVSGLRGLDGRRKRALLSENDFLQLAVSLMTRSVGAYGG